MTKSLTVDGQTYLTTTAYDAGSRALWRTFGDGDGDSLGSAATPLQLGRERSPPSPASSPPHLHAAGQAAVTGYANGASRSA